MSSILLNRAIGLYREGKKEEANRMLETVVRLEPTNRLAWNWYIETISDTLVQEEALEEYLVIDPSNLPARKQLDALKRRNGNDAVPFDPVILPTTMDNPVPHTDQETTIDPPPSELPNLQQISPGYDKNNPRPGGGPSVELSVPTRGKVLANPSPGGLSHSQSITSLIAFFIFFFLVVATLYTFKAY